MYIIHGSTAIEIFKKKHCCVKKFSYSTSELGAQWLSGRALDLRPKGRGFEPHLCHCIVSLSKTPLSSLSTGSTQEDPSRNNLINFDWDVKKQIKKSTLESKAFHIFKLSNYYIYPF